MNEHRTTVGPWNDVIHSIIAFRVRVDLHLGQSALLYVVRMSRTS